MPSINPAPLWAGNTLKYSCDRLSLQKYSDYLKAGSVKHQRVFKEDQQIYYIYR